LGDAGRYWNSAAEVAALIERAEHERDATLCRGEQSRARAAAYEWDDVAACYEKLCERLAARDVRRVRVSGRRSTRLDESAG
jgi:hypothetical protein